MAYETKYGEVTTERVAIPDDEPVFILRARDLHAAAAIGYYLSVCEADKAVSADHTAGVEEALRRFTQWHLANPDRMKVPDTTPDQMTRM